MSPTETDLCRQAYNLARENGEQIVFLGRVLILLAVLVVVKLIIVALTSMRTARMLNRVESLLAITERHGAMTDERVSELKGSTADAVKKVSAVIVAQAASVKQEIPAKVVEKIEEKTAAKSSDSGAIPIVGSPGVNPV